IGPEETEKYSLLISRLSVVVVGIIAFIIVLNPPESLGMLLWLGISGVASGTMGPLLATIFLPKLATRPAAIASLLVGVGSYIVILMIDLGPSNLASG